MRCAAVLGCQRRIWSSNLVRKVRSFLYSPISRSEDVPRESCPPICTFDALLLERQLCAMVSVNALRSTSARKPTLAYRRDKNQVISKLADCWSRRSTFRSGDMFARWPASRLVGDEAWLMLECLLADPLSNESDHRRLSHSMAKNAQACRRAWPRSLLLA